MDSCIDIVVDLPTINVEVHFPFEILNHVAALTYNASVPVEDLNIVNFYHDFAIDLLFFNCRRRACVISSGPEINISRHIADLSIATVVRR